MVINPDGTKTSSYTVGGVTTTTVIDKDGKVLSKTTGKANPSGNTTATNSSTKEPQYYIDYRRGGTGTNQETAYDFSNPTTGEKKTVYSNFTNYQDAMAEAGLDGWKLDTAVTYRKPNKSNDSYVSGSSEGGFADNALKTVQAADYLYGNNSGQLDESTRKYLEGIINGTVSTAGVSFGDASTYGGLLNGSTSKGTYDNLNFNYLKGLLENNTPARKEVTDDMMTTAEYQTYANSLKGNTAPVGSTAYTGDVNLYNGVGGYGDMNFNVGNNYGVPAYNGLTAGDIKDIYGSIWNAQEQQAANNTAFLKSLAESRRDDANKAYDETARQAWVQSMISQNNLPQMLKAQGLSGGASESSQLAQQLNYENIINNNETDRANALKDIDQSFFEAQTEANNNLLQIQAGLQQDMLGSLQNAINSETAFNQWVAEYNMARTEADRDYALKQAQLAKAEQEEAEARAWEYATLAAEYGDYSQLQALGVNPAVKSTPITSGGGTPPTKTAEEIAAEEEAQKIATINADLSRYGTDEEGKNAVGNHLNVKWADGTIDFDQYLKLSDDWGLAVSNVYESAKQWQRDTLDKYLNAQ